MVSTVLTTSFLQKFAGAQQEYRAFDIMDDLAKKIEPVHRAVIEFESLDDDMDIDQMDSTWDVEKYVFVSFSLLFVLVI